MSSQVVVREKRVRMRENACNTNALCAVTCVNKIIPESAKVRFAINIQSVQT